MATRKPETTSIESNWGELFDVKKIRRLAELMSEQELSELSLSTGTLRIRLRRGSEGVVVSGGVAPRAAAAPAASPPPAETPAPTPTDEHLHLIKSPMVGTFYISPNPEAPAFVKVGDHVGAETTVCIVEAMKVFNEIQAEVSGKIVAVLCENGEPVEYGQPLFKVDTRK